MEVHTDYRDITSELEYARYHCTSTKGKMAINDAIDLINRLQAEIENYSHNVKQLASDIRNYQIELQAMRNSANSFKSKYKSAVDTAKELQTVIKEKDAEIKRLTTIAKLGNMRADDYRAMRDKCKTARAEAIKEFAEGLIEKAYSDGKYEYRFYVENFLKEKLGESK